MPADWTDIEEDRKLQATTIPVRLGVESANRIVLVCVSAAIALSLVLLGFAPGGFRFPMGVTVLAVGGYLLFIPAYRLYKSKDRHDAMGLFNRASYYPLVLLVAAVTRLAL